MVNLRSFSLALATLVVTGSTMAVSVNPFDPAQGFNIVVEKDFRIDGGHPEGAIAVGGDFTFKGGAEVSQRYAGTFIAPGDTKGTNLLIGGQVNWSGSTGQMGAGNNAGFVKIAGGSATVHDWNPGETVINNSSNANSNPRIMTRADQTSASVKAATGFDFAAVASEFAQSSLQIAQLAATRTAAQLGLTGGLTTLNNFALDLGLNVFNLTGSEYRNIQNINWNNSAAPSASRTLIFNIDVQGASSYNFGYAAMGLQERDAPFVLFNFFNLDGSLNLIGGNQIVGSILAPKANIYKSGTYQHGQTFAESYDFKDGEVHFYRNQVTYTPPVVKVPDTASVTAFGMAFMAGLLAVRRRQVRA